MIKEHANVIAGATSAAGAVVNYTAPTWTDTVSDSGTATCTPASGSAFQLGNTTVTCTAIDGAGNAAIPTTFVVSVKFRTAGFYQPVDMGTQDKPVYNTVKGGSTVPLKFEVFAGTTELTDTAVVKKMAVSAVQCTNAPVDEIELLATGSTLLRYDTTAGQFIYNWKTPTGAGKCYNVVVTFWDDSSLSAFFKLK